jgi:hypothetical protein
MSKGGNQDWIDRVQDTYKYHADKLKLDKAWRIQDTAEMLDRSIGSVSQDLILAGWMKHSNPEEAQMVKRFKHAKDALTYIRHRKYQIIVDH